LSSDQWKVLLERTHAAITGEQASVADRDPWRVVEPTRRTEFLEQLITEWCGSQSFVRLQARRWVRDPILNGDVPSDVATQSSWWEPSLHDAWLEQSIARRESFFDFVRMQLSADLAHAAGEVDAEAIVATASWLRAACYAASAAAQDLANARQYYERGEMALLPKIDLPHALITPVRDSPDMPAVRKAWLSRVMPNVFEALTPLQRSQIDDGIQAIDSISKTENEDWHRLMRSATIAPWYRLQVAFPQPPAGQWTSQWPASDADILADDAIAIPDSQWLDRQGRRAPSMPWFTQSGNDLSIELKEPLSFDQQWSVVFHVHVLMNDDSTQPVRLFSQIDPLSLQGASEAAPGMSLEIDRGRLRFRWVDRFPMHLLEIVSSEVLDWSQPRQIAIVYDGMRSAAAVRLAVDGTFLDHFILADSMFRNPGKADKWVWQLGDRSEQAPRCRWEDFASFRVSLSEPELAGLEVGSARTPWELLSQREQLGWLEHFATRVDPHWRYERESHLFYLGNLARLRSSLPAIAVLDGRATWDPSAKGVRRDRFPFTLVSESQRTEASIPWSNRARLAAYMTQSPEGRLAIASNEVRRQWTALLDALPESESQEHVNAEELWDRTAQAFVESQGDRNVLLQQLLSSREWLAIALDSAE
jgi:hypothetical protein